MTADASGSWAAEVSGGWAAEVSGHASIFSNTKLMLLGTQEMRGISIVYKSNGLSLRCVMYFFDKEHNKIHLFLNIKYNI